MPYYKDINGDKTRNGKRRSAEERGGFEDEGSRYGGVKPRGGERPPLAQGQPAGRPVRGTVYGGGRNTGRPAQGTANTGSRYADRPARGTAYGGDRSAERPARGTAYGGDRGAERPARGTAYGGDRGAERPARGTAYGGDRSAERPAQGRTYDNSRYADRPARGTAYGGDRGAERPAQGRTYDNSRHTERPARGTAYGSDRGAERPAQGRTYDNSRRNERPARGTAYGDNRYSGRPAREDGGAARREGSMRFTRSEQQPYRGRGSGLQPRSYDEQRRDRRDTDAPRQSHNAVAPAPRRGFDAFRYEEPARPPRPVPVAPVAAETETEPNENLLSGRNPIREALKSGRDIEKLLVARGELSGSAREIVAMAKERHVPVQEVERVRLDAITTHHQGMLAYASAYQYHTVEDMLALAKERGEEPFLVVLDGITDPHNLGAIIRTAECAGAHGVIVQERRAVGLTPAAVKASAGAIEYVMVARVTNLVTTLETLKSLNIWLYAADMEGEDYATVDFKGGVALVIGAEGEGVSRLVLATCDRRVALPVRGKLDSLNASVAAGVLLYAAMRSRKP